MVHYKEWCTASADINRHLRRFTLDKHLVRLAQLHTLAWEVVKTKTEKWLWHIRAHGPDGEGSLQEPRPCTWPCQGKSQSHPKAIPLGSWGEQIPGEVWSKLCHLRRVPPEFCGAMERDLLFPQFLPKWPPHQNTVPQPSAIPGHPTLYYIC